MLVAVAEVAEHLGHGVLRDQERRHRRRPGRDLLHDDELFAYVAHTADVRRRAGREDTQPRERVVQHVVELLGLVERPDAVGRRDVGDEPPHRGAQLGRARRCRPRDPS